MLLKVFLLQLAVVALQTCPVASAGPFCPELFGGFEDLDSGNAVNLSLNCSSSILMPIITFETVESWTEDQGAFSVDYICRNLSSVQDLRNLSSVQPEPTGVLPSNIGNPTGTITVDTSDFSEGTECTFYGCYMSSGLPFRSSLAIQTTSCVIDINECEQGGHNCDVNATCDNTVGSFECRCNDGFTGNGTHCDAADGGDSFVQFVIVAVVIFVTLVATLLVITMYIRKVQKRRHTMWFERKQYFKKNMKEMKVDLDFKPVEPHATLPHSISFLSDFDILVVDTEDGLITDQEMSESILEPSAIIGDTGDSDINRNEDYEGMAFPKERERASEQTDYVIQPGTHNHGTGCTQDKDTGYLYSDTLPAGSCSHSLRFEQDTLERDIGLSEYDAAVLTSEQSDRRSDSYIKEHSLPSTNQAVISDFSFERASDSEQTDYIIQPGTHNQGTGDTQEEDTGYLYYDTLPAGSSSHSRLEQDTLEHDIGLSEYDAAVLSSEQSDCRSASYIKEHSLPSTNQTVISDFSFERASEQTDYIIQSHNQGTGDTQEEDTGYLYSDTLPAGSSSHSRLEQDTLEHDIGLSEYDTAVSSSEQYYHSDSYIKEQSLPNTNQTVISDFSFDESELWLDQSLNSFHQ